MAFYNLIHIRWWLCTRTTSEKMLRVDTWICRKVCDASKLCHTRCSKITGITKCPQHYPHQVLVGTQASHEGHKECGLKSHHKDTLHGSLWPLKFEASVPMTVPKEDCHFLFLYSFWLQTGTLCTFVYTRIFKIENRRVKKDLEITQPSISQHVHSEDHLWNL